MLPLYKLTIRDVEGFSVSHINEVLADIVNLDEEQVAHISTNLHVSREMDVITGPYEIVCTYHDKINNYCVSNNIDCVVKVHRNEANA